jgi:serine/arginine repetitive matrix protein 2
VAVDSSTVGIALSSPPPSAEEVAAVPARPIYVHDHPYAQGGYSLPRRSHTRSTSDYAGPHPSAVAVTAPASSLARDMSARHRLPPQAVLHPYATPSARPFTAPSQSAPAPPTVPPSEPFLTLPEAPVPLRPRLNPRPRRPMALSVARDAERVLPHAYAADSRFSSGPLVFADALSYGLQRRGSADSGLGESEGHHDAPPSSIATATCFTTRGLPPV